MVVVATAAAKGADGLGLLACIMNIWLGSSMGGGGSAQKLSAVDPDALTWSERCGGEGGAYPWPSGIWGSTDSTDCTDRSDCVDWQAVDAEEREETEAGRDCVEVDWLKSPLELARDRDSRCLLPRFPCSISCKRRSSSACAVKSIYMRSGARRVRMQCTIKSSWLAKQQQA